MPQFKCRACGSTVCIDPDIPVETVEGIFPVTDMCVSCGRAYLLGREDALRDVVTSGVSPAHPKGVNAYGS